MKYFNLFLIFLSITSCGRESVVMEPSSMGIVDSLINKKELSFVKTINDEVCIDDILINEMNEKEQVRRALTDTDISFCNGSRLRLKVLKMNDGKLRVYGFVISTLGKRSCLRDGSDFNKILFKGYEGTLIGEGIKISLGGHLYNNESKLVKNDSRKAQYVKFDSSSFKGEIGIFENSELTCTETL